jgi:serine protease Do
MKKIVLGLILISSIVTQSSAQEVVVITKDSKDTANKPLMIIDGVVSENKNMNDMSPTDIQSINVIKGPSAIEKYGKKGDKGVVEITTKGKYKTVIDTSNITVIVDGDNIMLNGEKVQSNDPRLKKIKRINVISGQSPALSANKAFLGVSTKATALGAQVVEVSEGSPAAKAGLKVDDIITKINNVAIEDHTDLFEEIGKHKPEDKINIEFSREGKSIKKEVVLAKNKMPSMARGRVLLDDLNNDLGSLNGDIEVFNFDNNNFNKNFNRDFKRGFRLPELPNLEGIDVMAKKPKLGISIEDLEEGQGVKIKAVNEGSPAAKAGLKIGDIITTIDKHEVKEVNDLKWQYFEAGQTIKVGISRNKEVKIIEVKIPKKINSADL